MILTLPFFIEISEKYPTFNEYINIERKNKNYANIIKQKYTTISYKYFLLKKINKYPIKIIFTWYYKNTNRDIDGYSFAKKCILDGMVRAGTIPNDNIKYIIETIDKVYKNNKDGVLIEIMESI